MCQADPGQQEFYRSLLEDYNLNPYSPSQRKKAIDALLSPSQQHILQAYIVDVFQDLARACVALDRAMVFDVDDVDDVDVFVFIIQDILQLSTDSKVQIALGNWKKAQCEFSDQMKKFSYYFSEHPEERV